MYKKYFKRIFDICFSIIAIVCFIPIYVVVGVGIAINLGCPIIFKQKRPGRDEKIFTIYKFRSMSNKKDKDGKLLSDKDRLTKFGRVLRNTSLDELPELFNILKGDMSIVGPRPLAVEYIGYYNEYESRRHSIRPGLTGLAQINGRNTINWEERFKYDIDYVDNITFINDIKIILLTIMKVFKKEDITVSGTTNIKDFHIYRQEQIRKEKEGVK